MSWWVPLLTSSVLTVVSLFSAWWSYRRYQLAPKRDTLRRLVGSRYMVVAPRTATLARTYHEFYTALNEVPIVFNRDDHVIDLAARFSRDPESQSLVALIRAMAVAAKVGMDRVDDRFLYEPLSPWRPNGD